MAEQLGLQLRPAVVLERVRSRGLGHRIRLRDPEDRARRGVDDLLDAGIARGEQKVGGAEDVHRPEQLAVARQRDLRHVVEHRVDPGAGACQRVAVANVALDELDVRTSLGGWVHVEDPDPLAPGERLVGEDAAEVAAPTGDEQRARHQSANPRSRHQRTLARIPSNSADLRVVAELDAGPGDVAGDRVLQLAQDVERLHVAPPALHEPVERRRDLAGDGRQPGLAARHRQPLRDQRGAHLAQDLGQLVGLGVRDPVRPPCGRGRRLGEQQTGDEVVRERHRAPLRARTDEREPAPADRGEPLGLACRLERAVEPGGADDHRLDVAAIVAPLDELFGFELGAAVPHVRVVRASPR